MDLDMEETMDASVVAAIGLEFLQVAVQAMMRGQKKVPQSEVEAARRRGRNSRTGLYDAINDHESEDDES